MRGRKLPTARREEGLRRACLLVARHYHGERGEWAYERYTRMNEKFFAGELPWPNISWALTPHGSCLGYTWSPSEQPTLVLHPSLFGGTEKEDPWGVDPSWLGPAFAADVLLHEMIHVSVAWRLGGWRGKGESSHNNDAWVAEASRIAPLLGLPAVKLGRSKIKRVPVQGAAPTKRGKVPTRVTRLSEGDVPFKAVASFPMGVRAHLGVAGEYYPRGELPA